MHKFLWHKIIEISVMNQYLTEELERQSFFCSIYFLINFFLLEPVFEIKDIVQTIYTVFFNPLTPVSDQDRISPYNSITISSRLVMSVKKNINKKIIN